MDQNTVGTLYVEGQDHIPEGGEPSGSFLVSSWADIAKAGTIGLGFLYAVGFLVVNFHLSQFGVAPAGWLRAEYLVAGTWCLAPIVVFGFALYYIVGSFLGSWLGGSLVIPRGARIFRYVSSAILGSCALLASFSMLTNTLRQISGAPEAGFFHWDSSSDITLKLAGFALVAVLTISMAIFALTNKRIHTRGDWALWKASSTIFWACMAISCAVGYIWMFSVSVYGLIPRNLGGGKPQAVVFILDPSVRRDCPIVADSSGKRSVSYELLLQTETSYIVKSPAKGETAIEFRQDSVLGMVMLAK